MALKCFIFSYLTVCLVLFKESDGSMRLEKEIWVSLPTDTTNTTANCLSKEIEMCMNYCTAGGQLLS